MGIDKLSLYNGALRILAERPLASLTENRSPRRILDSVWSEGLVDRVLEKGQWQWATRAAKLTNDPSVTPPFGYKYAFPKPDDCLRTCAISADEYFTEPLTRFVDEAKYWYSDYNILYVKFVSNGAAYGGDLSNWPPAFVDFVESFMAWKAGPRITGTASSADALKKAMETCLSAAQGIDGSDKPTVFPSVGGWNKARRGRLSLIGSTNNWSC